MIIYLIRHGQSVGNVNGIVQGHADFPLSNLGKKQASLLGEAMSHFPLDVIYSSDLIRAYYTAEAIAEHQSLALQKWAILREINLGPLQGLPREKINKDYPHLKQQSILTSNLKGTEPVEAITRRCSTTIEFLKEHHLKERVALVSHGGFISILLSYLVTKDQWASFDRPFIIGNTSISKIEINEGEKVKFHYINRMSHLEEDEILETSTALY